MKSIVFAVIVGAVAVPAAQAQIANPDNDSAAFFAQRMSSPATPKPAKSPLKAGDVSSDGLYVYSGTDRDWVHRVHAFDVTGGKATHINDGLAKNAPTPEKGGSRGIQSGPFAERGA